MTPEDNIKNEHIPAFEGEEDNNPFPNIQGLSSIMSEHNLGGGAQEDDEEIEEPMHNDESLILYDSNKKESADRNKHLSKDGFKSIQINSESRITRLLKQGSSLKMQIIKAGNSNEGMTNTLKTYIVYTILLVNTEDPKEEIQTRRRYSDFESLREILVKIFPLLVIPPIPPKNYFKLSMLNGIVSGNLLQNGANGNQMPTTGDHGNNYSYINSTHLNKGKLIEHRKRLLSNFLNNCLAIPKIRNFEFFAKFLDPNANWTDETKLISSQLPKSIYILNPENSLKTEPIYQYLPIPTNSHSINISFLKPLQENKKRSNKKAPKGREENEAILPGQPLAKTCDDGQSDMLSRYIIDTSQLDEINKKIMANFISLAKEYTDFGTAFNSFSLVISDAPSLSRKDEASEESEDAKVSLIVDKIGQVFDRSYITLNTLISEIETKFSEPLGEAVQYSEALEFVNKFRCRKIRQKKLVDDDLHDKKSELQELRKIEDESTRIENALSTGTISKDSKFDLRAERIQNENNNKKENSKTASNVKYKSLPGIGSFRRFTQYITDIIDQNPEDTRRQKIVNLEKKIEVLEKCHSVMLKDIAYINDEVERTFRKFHIKQLKAIYKILLSYYGFLANWGRKNIEIWEEIRDEVKKI